MNTYFLFHPWSEFRVLHVSIAISNLINCTQTYELPIRAITKIIFLLNIIFYHLPTYDAPRSFKFVQIYNLNDKLVQI